MPSLALQGLLADLTRDFHSEHHGQTVDVVQYCADWFQHKLKRERAATQSSTISRAGPGASMGSARKFPNFPTMSLPQTPGNIFQSAISQPSPFSEHAPSDSPFGNGMLSQRRATLANTDASVLNSNLSNATNPFGSSSNFTSSQAGPFGSTTNQQLPQLMEEGSPDEDTAMETSSPPAGDAPNSFANFSFSDGNGPSPFNEPSPFQANKLPPQAISSGSAQASADELRPPSYALGRRTSVSAESLVPNHATFGASSQSENVTDPGNTEPKPNVPKSDSQLLRIRQAIGQNFLFRNLDEEQEKDVLAAMREVQVKQGEVVIEQGATGDFFYVVEAGDFDIFKRDDRTDQQTDPAPTEQTRGKKVHTAGPGGSFGELALMYNAPRAASVIAKGDGTLWALDRISFRTILLDHTSRKRRMYETFLLSVPILASLEGYERAKIADALESRTYQSGELVIQEGESGDDFYIIESGSALVEKSDAGVIGELKRGDYFGELALLNRAPRAATVKAGGRSGEKLRVAALGEKAFTRLLGPVREIMARKAGEMYGTAGAYRS